MGFGALLTKHCVSTNSILNGCVCHVTQEYDEDGLHVTAATSMEAARKADRLLEKEAAEIEKALERRRREEFEEQQLREQEFQQVSLLATGDL